MPPIIPLNFNFQEDSKRFLKPKSNTFVAVQAALDTYVQTSTAANLLALTAALGTWKRTKQHGQQNWTGSIRATQVQQLDAWLIAESHAQGIFPAPEPGWNGGHNCYAYAMKCLAPLGLGHNSWPGRLAGIATGGNFAQGVVNDATHQHLNAQIVRAGGVPAPVPHGVGGGGYLAAVVANNVGFHFMRRNEMTGLWTHKNGAFENESTYFYDRTLEQPVAITDQVVATILANPQLIGCAMTFHAYISVPNAGLQVRG